MSTDIGISGQCIKASAHEYERRGVIYLVEDNLEDLIYSESKINERYCELWDYDGHTPARRSIFSQIRLTHSVEWLNTVSSLLV